VKKIIFIFFCLFVTVPLLASNNPFETGRYVEPKKYNATYFIDPSGSNTTGTGTLLNPWQTLAYATTQVTTPNNLIFLQPGTYIETTTVNLAVGVSLQGDSSNTIIRSTVTGFLNPIIELASLTEGTNGNQSISNLQFNDLDRSTSAAIKILARGGVDINSCVFKSFEDAAVLISAKASFFPNNTEPSVYASNNTFHHNYTWDCAGFVNIGTYGSAHVWAHGQLNFTFHHNYMQQTNRIQEENGWLLKILDFSKGTKIYNNTLQAALFPSYLSFDGQNGYHGFAIELADQDGCEIYNNDIQGAVDCNRQKLGGYPYSIFIHNNYIHRSGVPQGKEFGIYLEFSTDGAIIEDNIIENVQHALFFSLRNGDSVINTVIRRNEFRNLGGPVNGGGQGEGIQFNCDAGNFYKINNVNIDNNSITANPSYFAPWGISFSNTNGVTNLRIRNNAIQGFSGAWVVSGNTSAINSLIIQNNNPFNNGGGNNPFFPNGTPSGYTYTGNITTNPLFINSATNLRLQAGSPCIDAGIDVGNGNDIGAYQFSEGGNISPSVTATATPTSMTLPANTSLLQAVGTDADGEIISFVWTKQSGSNSFAFTSGNSATTTVTNLIAGVYIFRVTVTDNLGATSFYDVPVTVNAAPPQTGVIRYYRPLRF
jgi:hypothetical protein